MFDTLDELGLGRVDLVGHSFGAIHDPAMPALEDREVDRNQLLVEGCDNPFHGFRRAINPDLGEALPAGEDVCQPTLVIAGRHDPLIPLPLVDRTTNHLNRGQLVILEDSAHSGMEEQPQEVARRIREFLRGGQSSSGLPGTLRPHPSSRQSRTSFARSGR